MTTTWLLEYRNRSLYERLYLYLLIEIAYNSYIVKILQGF